jgi:broad specificity phosphatase PhoE
MAKLFLVRHGQSLGNLGGKVDIRYEKHPLTELGRQQSQAFADSVVSPPDLIVSSPFQRALETAAPLRSKFPTVPFETWSVHELAFLDPDSCLGTTPEDRSARHDQFWKGNDPLFRDGPGSETFSEFVERGRSFLARGRSLESKVNVVYVFTHGNFMRLIELLLRHSEYDDKTLMAQFASDFAPCVIENCAVIEIEP